MLDNDLINKEIIGKTFISQIYYFDELSSTNDFAKENKEEDNILVIAEYQSAGRGRFDRKWENEKGKNLIFTIKKQFRLNIKDSNYINFFFTFFLYSALKKFIEHNFPLLDTNKLEVKWPNDILFDSKKICGILIESKSNGKEYLLGTGININQINFKNLPQAGSLSMFAKKDINRSSLLIEIIKEIDNNLYMLDTGNLRETYRLWKSSTKMIGKLIDIEIYGVQLKSVKIIDLLDDGTIELLINDTKKRLTSSEISFSRYTDL